MEASYVFYVKFDTGDRLEQNKPCIFTITTSGQVMLVTVQHDLMVCVSFM